MQKCGLFRLNALAGVVFVGLAVPASADTFKISLDTSPLSGIHTLGFSLTDGDGLSNNTLTLSDFTFGGGSAVGGSEDCTLGGGLTGDGCSGDLGNVVELTDVTFLTFFTQQFTAGTTLTFELTTTNSFGGGTPDQFAMFVCNESFSGCYSDDSLTAAMLLLDLRGDPLSPSSFVTVGAAEQELDAPVVSAVPEPGSLMLLGAGIAAAIARRSTRARRAGWSTDSK